MALFLPLPCLCLPIPVVSCLPLRFNGRPNFSGSHLWCLQFTLYPHPLAPPAVGLFCQVCSSLREPLEIRERLPLPWDTLHRRLVWQAVHKLAFSFCATPQLGAFALSPTLTSAYGSLETTDRSKPSPGLHLGHCPY